MKALEFSRKEQALTSILAAIGTFTCADISNEDKTAAMDLVERLMNQFTIGEVTALREKLWTRAQVESLLTELEEDDIS